MSLPCPGCHKKDGRKVHTECGYEQNYSIPDTGWRWMPTWEGRRKDKTCGAERACCAHDVCCFCGGRYG